MIELKKIKRDNEQIACEAFIEDCNEPVNLSLNIRNKELNSFVLPPDYNWCTTHIDKAKDFLLSLLDVTDIPNKKRIMWY